MPIFSWGQAGVDLGCRAEQGERCSDSAARPRAVFVDDDATDERPYGERDLAYADQERHASLGGYAQDPCL
ncbi:hypothetical protein ACWCQ1_43445 [Streptomyces sp. NPDC002144]